MADCKVSDIMREVRVAADMNAEDTGLEGIGAPDTLDVNEIVRSKIEQSLRDVLVSAPVTALEGGYDMRESLKVTWEKRGTLYRGRAALPRDFLRLVRVKVEGWDTAVSTPVSEDDPSYARCLSSMAGITGNPERPAAAVVPGAGGMMLELYSAETPGAVLEEARYVPIPRTTGIGTEGSTYFGGIETADKVEDGGTLDKYIAFYDTVTKLFVFQNDVPGIHDLRFYKTCNEEDKYNDNSREPATIRQDTTYTDGKSLYRYSAETGGLAKVADISDETIDIPVLLHDAVIYRCAQLVYMTLGDDAGANRMAELLKE